MYGKSWELRDKEDRLVEDVLLAVPLIGGQWYLVQLVRCHRCGHQDVERVPNPTLGVVSHQADLLDSWAKQRQSELEAGGQYGGCRHCRGRRVEVTEGRGGRCKS